MSEQKAEPAEARWCLVGNIVQERYFGEGGLTRKQGTKHFPPGTKVYCFPVNWGDGYEQIVVVGRHRGSHRFCTMIVSCHHITNWRPKLVYSPEVHRLMDKWESQDGRNATWGDREDIESLLPWILAREREWIAKHARPDDNASAAGESPAHEE